MAVYEINKLIEETRRLAAEFKRTTGTMLPVSGEIARYDVSHNLELTLTEQRSNGVDALGTGEREGKRIQIKNRIVDGAVKSGHRIGQLNMDGDWDLIILSIMNNEFEPIEMYEATREDIEDALSSNTNRSKRGAMSVARFKIIGTLVWTKETGTNL